MLDIQLKQQILGCLYGQAIGDAMGMPSELWTQNQVRAFFGEISEFLPGPKENIAASTFKAGEFTDDTQQAIAMIKAIIKCQGAISATVIAQYIMAWAKETNAFELNILGPTSKAALLAIKAGTPIEKIVANGVTNGSVMRVSPIGCLLPTDNRDEFIQGVANSCYATHKSDIAIAGAAVVSWAISRAIEGADWHIIKQELIDLARDVQQQFESTFSAALSCRIEYAFTLAKQLAGYDSELILTALYQHIGAGMDVIETVPTALAIVDIVQGDPIKAAYYCANLGGDTDTIGAIATAICGAIKGISAFPIHMIKQINVANNIDFTAMAESLVVFRQQRIAS